MFKILFEKVNDRFIMHFEQSQALTQLLKLLTDKVYSYEFDEFLYTEKEVETFTRTAHTHFGKVDISQAQRGRTYHPSLCNKLSSTEVANPSYCQEVDNESLTVNLSPIKPIVNPVKWSNGFKKLRESGPDSPDASRAQKIDAHPAWFDRFKRRKLQFTEEKKKKATVKNLRNG
jgi:hypothetical protein